MVPPCSDRISRVPPYSRLQCRLPCTGLSPTEAQLSRWFHSASLQHWPSPRSLATTSGVSVDVLSSGYLDVSVPRVCFYSPMYSGIDTFDQMPGYRGSGTGLRRHLNPENPASEGGLPHSEICGSNGCSHLTTAYRSVPRPSSPPTAKASTRCP